MEDQSASISTSGARWHQIKTILAEALECQGEESRALLVAESCRGDVVLAAEVEALLAHDDDGAWCDESFLDGLRTKLGLADAAT